MFFRPLSSFQYVSVALQNILLVHEIRVPLLLTLLFLYLYTYERASYGNIVKRFIELMSELRQMHETINAQYAEIAGLNCNMGETAKREPRTSQAVW